MKASHLWPSLLAVTVTAAFAVVLVVRLTSGWATVRGSCLVFIGAVFALVGVLNWSFRTDQRPEMDDGPTTSAPRPDSSIPPDVTY